MSPALHFDADYREDLSLADGTPVRIRMVRPEDKAALRDGFLRLSPESRYRRFFSRKNDLSEAELRFLTEFDGVNHFALGASTLDAGGAEREGVGVARFVRLEQDPEEAEFALAVTDDMQGKGLGRALLERLVAAAAERGVKRFRCTLLAENDRMRELILDLWGDAIFTEDGPMMTARFPLPETTLTGADGGAVERVVELLRQVAKGTVVVALARGLADSGAWLERTVGRLRRGARR